MLIFRTVLEGIENFAWDQSVFLPRGQSWNLDSPCVVWDADDLEDGHDVPAVAVRNGMEYVLGISALQDVVANARMQKDCSLEDLFGAFIFYVQNDAFIEF